MIRQFRVALAYSAVSLFALAATASTPRPAEASWKVTICHIPPGNPDNAHTITVSWSAVVAHLSHGDALGQCGGGLPI